MAWIGSRAHNLGDRLRTCDVQLNEEKAVDFDGMCLHDNVLKGLKKAGYVRPSPIQLEAIPIGRCGFDMIVQAKSGTGKTCVFAVVALESINVECRSIQVLILAPTREIVLQISEVMISLGHEVKKLQCCAFIGGMPLADDKLKLKKCHIAVGTPGRIKHLIEDKVLKTEAIRLFVLDEADKLLDEHFQKAINWIYHKLPTSKQVLAMSATYPEELATLLTMYMQNPVFVRLNSQSPALVGISQFYKVTSYHPSQHKAYENKLPSLLQILSSLSFAQCFIFSNYQLRAQGLCDHLRSSGWPAAVISGMQEQKERLHAISQLKQFQCRILISTDLTARGIDAENVNLVINLDVPWDAETYLHRIGRAGRYGSYGIAVTLATEGEEHDMLKKIIHDGNLDISSLPDVINSNFWNKMCKDFNSSLSLAINKSQSESVVTTAEKFISSVDGAHKESVDIDAPGASSDSSSEECVPRIGAVFIEHLKMSENKKQVEEGLATNSASDSSSSCGLSRSLVCDTSGKAIDDRCRTDTEFVENHTDERPHLSSLRAVTKELISFDKSYFQSDEFQRTLCDAVNRLNGSSSVNFKRLLSFDECKKQFNEITVNGESDSDIGAESNFKSITNLTFRRRERDDGSYFEDASTILRFVKWNRQEFHKHAVSNLKDLAVSDEVLGSCLKYFSSEFVCDSLQSNNRAELDSSGHFQDVEDSYTQNDLGRPRSNEILNKSQYGESYTLDADASESEDQFTSSSSSCEIEEVTEDSSSHSENLSDTSSSTELELSEQWLLWYSSVQAKKYQVWQSTYINFMLSKD